MVKCNHQGCKKRAYYNNQDPPKFCNIHKHEDMIYITNRKCNEKGCTKQPNYNIPGETKGLFCSSHKRPNMVLVTNKNICNEIGCTKQSNYNFYGETKALFCAKHKKEGMIDIKKKTCKEENCTKKPCYNNPGESKGIYCVAHKEEGMINVTAVYCKEEGCKTQPRFNFRGEKKGLYCGTHKKEGMIDIFEKRYCEEEKCEIRASYNFENEKVPKYCGTHKKDGMIDLNNSLCIYEGCSTRAVFNSEGTKIGLYCNKHKKENMIDVRNPRCLTPMCDIIKVDKKYKGYCVFCFMHLFPEEPVSKNYKTKEKTVVDFIKENFNNFDWIYNKKIANGCYNRMPDLLTFIKKDDSAKHRASSTNGAEGDKGDKKEQYIIVEIDEDQHNSYDCSCENKRLVEISKDLGHKSVVFIRFNPDSYLNSKEEKVKGCWTYSSKGVVSVSKNNSKRWEHRLNMLKESINYWSNNFTNKTIEVIQLFYDGCE